jgi:hypothetical protein
MDVLVCHGKGRETYVNLEDILKSQQELLE